MKNIGIWIDKEQAYLVYLENNKEKLTIIKSKIENYHVVGGTRSKTRWGPQQVVHDSKYLEREKHQFKNYFKQIAELIKDADAIAIFGPADTNYKLQKELSNYYKHIASNVTKVQKVDSMTKNQIIALVRDHFDN